MGARGLGAAVGALAAGWSVSAGAAPDTVVPDTVVQGVTVTAGAPDARTTLDRRIYSIGKDLQAATGSIADVLRNIPSVDVDPQGNVSLRGDEDVTILIDGKPSAQFKGDGRAAALQSLPADRIERIEVITTPSAALVPEGSAGIINIVMKTTARPGRPGSARMAAGNRRRWSAGLGGAWNPGRVSLSADLAARRDPSRFSATETRQAVSADGRGAAGSDVSHLDGRTLAWNGRAAADAELARATHLSAQLRHDQSQARQEGEEHFTLQTASNALGPAYDRDMLPSRFTVHDTELSGVLKREFTGEDHALTLSPRREWSDYGFARPDRIVPLPAPAAPVFGLFQTRQSLMATGLKADYQRRVAGGRLKVGYELQIDRDVFANLRAEGPSPGALMPLPGFTDRLLYRQTINALYLSYERTLRDLTAEAGLRGEQVLIRLDQQTLGREDKILYDQAYPSLHLAYALADRRKLSAGYSRRVRRPQPNELNPFPQYGDPRTFYAGDPRLKPEITDSVETAYEDRRDGANRLATLFYRDTRNAILSVAEPLADGALLNTKRNVGRSRSAGLELSANGRLTRDLRYNASAAMVWTRIEADAPGLARSRSATFPSSKATLTWSPTAADLFQASGSLDAKRLTPQGHILTGGALNLAYRHRLAPGLFAAITVRDALNSFRSVSVYETPTLLERRSFRTNGPGVVIGLTYDFGGAGSAAREPLDTGEARAEGG